MRLLYLTTDEIEKLIQEFDQDTKAIKRELFKICWCMRGGLSYFESLTLSIEEREIISLIVEENLNVTKETGMAFF